MRSQVFFLSTGVAHELSTYMATLPSLLREHLGAIIFTFSPEHVPLKKNYPHSEIWVFRDHVHICKKDKNVDLLDPEFHLRWRERLSMLAHVIIQPTEEE
jgi:hypothetical protein